MQAVLGRSSLSYFRTCEYLLKTSSESVDGIAAHVGYAEGATLRLLLRRRLGQGVKEIRRSSLK